MMKGCQYFTREIYPQFFETHFHQAVFLLLYVKLYKNGKGRTKQISRLVGQAFIPNPENKPQINHIDGIKTNNDVSNLEWATNGENQKHAYRIGLKFPVRCFLGKTGYAHHSSEPVKFFIGDKFIREYGSCRDAARDLGLNKALVYSLASGKIKKNRKNYKFIRV